jgi:hypothetical protein
MAALLYILHGERPEDFPVELELTGTPAQELSLALAGLDQAALLEGLCHREGHTYYPLSAQEAGRIARATGLGDLDNGAPYFRGGLFTPPEDVVGWTLNIQVLHCLGRGMQTR